jgi:CheY-like chemotaxis protein
MLPQKSKTPMTSPHILVVDDQPDIRHLLSMFFSRCGFTVSQAEDGQDGIEMARALHPDVIVMDIQMPRKTGLEAVRELRTDPQFAHKPILAITAYAHVHVPTELAHAGFNHVLFKPIDFGVLQQIVTDELAAHVPEHAAQ